MNFDDVIKSRRSIRKFNEREVKKEIIDKIIWAGSLAPSAHNRQPWEVVVLKEKKKDIIKIMRDYSSKNSDDISIIKTADTIQRADTLLLIYCNNFEQYEYNLLSMGAMIQNMILAATSLKVASVWIANICPMREEIDKCLSIDSKSKCLVSAIALGYSDYEPKEIARKKVSDFTNYV